MPDFLLLTGATGLLGRYLLRDLLLAGRPIAALVRPSRKESAEDRLRSIIAMWEQESGQPLPKPVCLEGDICEDGLGLDSESKNWIEANCSSMLHSAASLTFHSTSDGEPYRSNVQGTKNVLGVCRETNIRKMHYVSTAYVCGLRSDLVREGELDLGQDFRNDYERTKLEAETLVRNSNLFDETTVYRPAVISGDSVTGYTNTYHGVYLYLRLMAMFVPLQEKGGDGRRYTPIRLPMTGNEKRNVVPVDWVSAVMTHLITSPESAGHTFNLAPEVPLTPRELIDACYSYFHSTGVQYVGDTRIDPESYNDFEAALLPNMTLYDNYKSTDPVFDRTNLLKFAGHIPCPVIDEEIVHRYIRFGENDRWGKRKPRKSEAHDGSPQESGSLNDSAHSTVS